MGEAFFERQPTEAERARFAIYCAIVAALRTRHPRRVQVALALEALAARYQDDAQLATGEQATGVK